MNILFILFFTNEYESKRGGCPVIRKIYIFILLFLASLFYADGAYAVKISIEAPSFEERVMESERDFYVIGKIDREGIAPEKMAVDIRVEVVETGEARAGNHLVIRHVQSRADKISGITPPEDIMFAYSGKAPWSDITDEELMQSPPPDLVYRHGDEKSFYDPSLKAAVTKDSFAVLVQGGCTKDYDSDYKKVYDGDLAWKSYRVYVFALCEGKIAAKEEFDVIMGSVPDKVLARFSPAGHFAKVLDFARENNFRVYRDSFPGYWNRGLSKTYEIPVRWRANDAQEYLSPVVHAVMYNIPETRNASQTVEIGKIANDGWLDDRDEIIYYCYDTGEPSMKYRAWYGTGIMEGRISPFARGDRLRFTRAEFDAAEKYSPEKDVPVVDWKVGDSVTMDRGMTLTLYGAVTPIQPKPADVKQNPDGTFFIGNRISKLRYDFVDMTDGVLYSCEYPIFMTRFYGTDKERKADSIYEFRHTFRFPPSMYGKIVTVKTTAYDLKGAAADGAEENFYLRIR